MMKISQLLRERPRYVWPLVLALAVLLTTVIYAPGLSGDLYLDSVKLYQLEDIYKERGSAVNVSELGFGEKYGRIIPQISFYLNIAIDDGINPFSIKATNLLIHLINALLVYALVSRILTRTSLRDRRILLATVVALTWLISAVNISGVLYAIQRMNQLATLFSLIALILYFDIRGIESNRLTLNRRTLSRVLGVTVFSIGAYACKENALLIPVFIILIELFLFPDLSVQLRKTPVLLSVSVSAVAALFLSVWLLHESSMMDYSTRSFSFEERLLTQTRIIWLYISQLLLPSLAATGLYQDGYPVSVGFFSPVTTITSIAGLLVFIVFAVRYRGHEVLAPVAFGIAFFLGGHLLESTVFPLELYYEHRNYLPSLGLYLAFAVSAYLLLSRMRSAHRIAITLTYFTFVAFMAHAKSVTWSDELYAFNSALSRSYLSPRAASGMAQIHLEKGEVLPAFQLLDRVIGESPNQAFRARLQKLYVECAAGFPVDAGLYEGLPEVTGRELDIEISQALSNVVDIYTRTRCNAVNLDMLIPILMSMSETLRTNGRSSWHIDYYVSAFYSSYDTTRAVAWLEERFLDGEESAGWVLLDMLGQDESASVEKSTLAALNELKLEEE